MSARTLPYHLRPNKAIDRYLFIDLLSRLDAAIRVETYEYVGMGGPQMEDFRLLHERFHDLPMLSIEEDLHVFRRQQFNQPHTRMRLRNETVGTYLAGFAPSRRRTIAWLDYTEAGKRPEQVAEFQELLRKAASLSVVKLTMNAHASTLGGTPGPGLQAARLGKLRSDFGRFLGTDIDEGAVRTATFPTTLLAILELACGEALANRPTWRFEPLLSLVYSDGHTMLSVTGIVGERPAIEKVLNASKIRKWHFSATSWHPPKDINVPDLTLKERIIIDQLLPRNQNRLPTIQRRLKFQFVADAKENEETLQQYVDFCRHYPFFSHVVI
jgi:hypothetical protein